MREHLSGTVEESKPREGSYFLLFTVLCGACLFGIAWHEIQNGESRGWLAASIAVLQAMEAAVVVMAALTVTLLEGGAMLAERYLKRRYEVGREVGRKEGSLETYQAWEQWNERRVEAARRGEPFDEPPPSPSEKNGRG